jgi:hypothetical protein
MTRCMMKGCGQSFPSGPNAVADHNRTVHGRSANGRNCFYCQVQVDAKGWNRHVETQQHLLNVDAANYASADKRRRVGDAAVDAGADDQDDDNDFLAGGGFGGFDNNDLASPFVSDDEDAAAEADRQRDDEFEYLDDELLRPEPGEPLVDDHYDDGGGDNAGDDIAQQLRTLASDACDVLRSIDDLLAEACNPPQIPFALNAVTDIDVRSFFSSRDVQQAPAGFDDMLRRFRLATASCSRDAVESLAGLVNEFSDLRIAARVDEHAVSNGVALETYYPVKFPATLAAVQKEADLPELPSRSTAIDGVAVSFFDLRDVVALRLELDRRAGVLDSPHAIDDRALAAAPEGSLDLLGDRSLLPATCRETIGWRMIGRSFRQAILAGAMCERIALYKDECIVGGAPRTVLRCGLLRTDADLATVLPLLSVYSAQKVCETLLMSATLLPALDALAAGVRVTLGDGSSRLVVAALYVMPADMCDRWATWMVRRFSSPLLVPTPGDMVHRTPTAAPQSMRCVERCARVVALGARVTEPPHRVKTRVVESLALAGLSKGLWTAQGQLIVPFVYAERLHLQLFRCGVGALRAAPDPIHTFGSGVFRNVEHLVGWVVYHYSASLVDRGGAGRGDVALATLCAAVRRLPAWPTCNRPAGDFWYKFDSKVP